MMDDRGCWEWIGGTDRFGHGSMGIRRKHYGAHRVSWEIHNGAIKDDLFVLHRCDNPTCVNPRHLFLGTQGDNIRDAVQKGRHKHAVLPGTLNPSAKLTESQVLEIRARHAAEGISGYRLAKEYGIHEKTAVQIIRGEKWKHLGGFLDVR